MRGLSFVLLATLLIGEGVLAQGSNKEYFDKIIDHIYSGNISPEIYSDISKESLIFLSCTTNADVSMRLNGKSQIYENKKIEMYAAFNNDIWLMSFSSHNSWVPLYHYDPNRGATIDAIAYLEMTRSDVTEGSFQRYGDTFKFVMSNSFPYGYEYDNSGSRVRQEIMKWSIDTSNVLNGKSMDKLRFIYKTERIIQRQGRNDEPVTSQDGIGFCKVTS